MYLQLEISHVQTLSNISHKLERSFQDQKTEKEKSLDYQCFAAMDGHQTSGQCIFQSDETPIHPTAVRLGNLIPIASIPFCRVSRSLSEKKEKIVDLSFVKGSKSRGEPKIHVLEL